MLFPLLQSMDSPQPPADRQGGASSSSETGVAAEFASLLQELMTLMVPRASLNEQAAGTSDTTPVDPEAVEAAEAETPATPAAQEGGEALDALETSPETGPETALQTENTLPPEALTESGEAALPLSSKQKEVRTTSAEPGALPAAAAQNSASGVLEPLLAGPLEPAEAELISDLVVLKQEVRKALQDALSLPAETPFLEEGDGSGPEKSPTGGSSLSLLRHALSAPLLKPSAPAENSPLEEVTPTVPPGSEKVNLGTPGAVTLASLDTSPAPEAQPPPARVTLENLPEQVVRQVRLQVQQESSSVSLKLHPATLGELGVEVVQRADEVTVRLIAANQLVRETLEAHAPLLREQLAREGMNNPQVVVATEHTKGFFLNQEARQGAPDQQSGGRRRVFNDGYAGDNASQVKGGSFSPTHPGALNLFV